MDALLDTIEQLQGAALSASEFEREILAARIEGYSPLDLDALAAAGEVAWVGVEPLGERDGRIALYLADSLGHLWRPPPLAEGDLPQRERRLVELLRARGASFFAELHAASGGGYPGQTLDALWDLVFKGLLTNDLFLPLRAFAREKETRHRRPEAPGSFRSRREAPPSSEGRWSLVESRAAKRGTDTAFGAALAQQLLARYGVVTRDLASAEAIPGGFGAVYEVLKAMEEGGRIRRGLFASQVGALQFALPAAVDLLRALRDDPEKPEAVTLAATDPANAWGAMLKWPALDGEAGARPSRSIGAHVVLVNGALAAYAGRGGRQLLAFLPADEPERSRTAGAIAEQLARLAQTSRKGFELDTIDGLAARSHALAPFLSAAGFSAGPRGLHWLRRGWVAAPGPATDGDLEDEGASEPLH
jgi:ATP-dependent Lhr-like helicase